MHAEAQSIRPGTGGLYWAVGVVLMLAVSGCATFPSDYPRRPSVAFPSPQETTLGGQFADQTKGHEGKSGFHLIETGTDALAGRALLAQKAEKTIDMQYYIIRDDESTALLMDRLTKAAERGVRVRILLDDMGRDFKLNVLATHSNIEVRLFNPFFRQGPFSLLRTFEFLGDFERLNRRMHNKVFVIDSAAAIVGGRNVGNEYFSAPANVSLVDLDVLTIGPVVKEISESFDAFWNSDWAVPVEAFARATPSAEELQELRAIIKERLDSVQGSAYAQTVEESHLLDPSANGGLSFILAPSKAVYDQPAKIKASDNLPDSAHVHYGPEIEAVISATQRELTIISPYFVPGPECMELFKVLAERGVRIRLLTNSLASTDVPAVHAGYARYRPDLLRLGVELFELRPLPGAIEYRQKLQKRASRAALHAKAFVVDRRIVYIGSMNFDQRSKSLNTELGLLIDSKDLADEVLGLFDQVTQPGQSFRVISAWDDFESLIWITAEEEEGEVRYREEPAGFWRRVLNPILSLFAPESLL